MKSECVCRFSFVLYLVYSDLDYDEGFERDKPFCLEIGLQTRDAL